MKPKLITLSIDVTQLDRARFKEIVRKGNGPRAGMKAVFVDLVLVATPDSEFGDYIVKQQVTKDERAARLEMPILGNGKAWDNGPAKPQAKDEPQGAPQPGEVPF